MYVARIEPLSDAPLTFLGARRLLAALGNVTRIYVARFTVAEHPDTESTTWRTILAFGKRAEGLAQNPLVKGQAVEAPVKI